VLEGAELSTEDLFLKNFLRFTPVFGLFLAMSAQAMPGIGVCSFTFHGVLGDEPREERVYVAAEATGQECVDALEESCTRICEFEMENPREYNFDCALIETRCN
jgi:hypothetical protein